MYDSKVVQADRIEGRTLRKLDGLYSALPSSLMEKHKATFEKLEKLEKEGAYGRARVLVRRSGLIDDWAKAIASAGKDAAKVIRQEIDGVREVASDDDEEEAGGTG